AGPAHTATRRRTDRTDRTDRPNRVGRDAPSHRRTQAERTATTRALLLDATVECLADLGYARMTTADVAARAGLSRGAQLYHFASKAELVATAVDHLLERLHAQFLEAMAGLPAGAERGPAVVESLWELCTGRTFAAWLEFV